MSIRKNGFQPDRDGIGLPRHDEKRAEQSKVNDEDNLDTRNIAHDIEEGDEDYDDEQLERNMEQEKDDADKESDNII